jgi:hypothetical protein
MQRLNMCMFASKVDYDAAVRKRCEQEDSQRAPSSFEISQINLRKALTQRNKVCTIRTSLKQGEK